MTDNVFTLDAVRDDLESKFKPCLVRLSDGTDVELRGLLRLKKDARRSVKNNLEKLEGIEKRESTSQDAGEQLDLVDETQETIEAILTAVCPQYSALLDDIDGDLPVTMAVFQRWLSETQAGEAHSSPNSSTSTAGSSSLTSESDTESTSETSSEGQVNPLFSAPATS